MTPLSVLRGNRDFRRMFLAELVVFGGDWFVMVPLLVLLTKLTGGGLLGGLALAADTGIQALLLPYAGVVADRVDRRRIMIIANCAAFAAVLLLLLVRTPGTAWLGPVAVGAVAVAKAFYSPAATAALPNIVEPDELGPANAVAGSAWGTMTVVGSSLGGVLSAAFSPYTCFLITAALLAAAAALTLGVRRPMQASWDTAVPHRKARAAMVEALRYIAHRPRVMALVTVKSAVGTGNGVLAVFAVLAASVFLVGPTGTGLMFAARGLGALLGPILLRRVLGHREWLLPGLAISMATYGLAYLGVSVTVWFPVAMVLIVIAHMAGGANWTMSNVALQIEVPDALRGRVFATDQMIVMLTVSASQLTVGALEGHVPVRVLVACCGLITLVYAAAWRLWTLRTARRAPVTGVVVPKMSR
ncbi:MAG TPA: MFS transporter [Micromonosporaceae bacterium]|nr:MFS transporter [Micromonosporaceae bacterium]